MLPTIRSSTVRARLIVTIVLVACAALLTVACGDDDGDNGTPTATGATSSGEATPSPPPICTGENAQRGTITTLDFNGEGGNTFDRGEDIEITLSIVNCGDNDIVLLYKTAQRYVIFAEDSAKNEVWSSADGESFDQVEGQEIIPPNETVVYSETWDQAGRDGVQVPDGVYKISAFSIGCVPGNEADPGQTCRFGPIRQVRIGEPPAS